MKFADVVWGQRHLDDDILLDVSACTISVLTRGRNAWGGTWVRHWFHNSHLFSDGRSACLGAEPLRQRGNVFYVNDRPALLLTGLYSTYVVFDGFRDHSLEQPFRGFSGFAQHVVETPVGGYCTGIFPGVTMREVHRELQNPQRWRHTIDSNSLRFGAVPQGHHAQALNGTTFAARVSAPRGSDYLLGWIHSEKQIVTTSVRAIEDAWKQMITSIDGATALAAQVREHGQRRDHQSLARLLRERFTDDNHPARTREDLRTRFEAAIKEARHAVEKSRKDLATARKAERDAEVELAAANEFARDPWSSPARRELKSSADVVAFRERMNNADLLIEQAVAWHAAAARAVRDARQRLRESMQDLVDLKEL